MYSAYYTILFYAVLIPGLKSSRQLQIDISFNSLWYENSTCNAYKYKTATKTVKYVIKKMLLLKPLTDCRKISTIILTLKKNIKYHKVSTS